MPKSSIEKIEFDEKMVIDELQKNSKQGIESLAKKCGFSRQKVWRTIKKLEQNKTIWGYRAVVDDEKIGRKCFQVLIKKSPTSLSNKMVDSLLGEDVKNKLESHGAKFVFSAYTQGHFDFSLCMTSPDIKNIQRFLEALKGSFGEKIAEIQVLEVVFPLMNCGINNPNIEGFKEFFLP